MNWKKFERFFEPDWGKKIKGFIESKDCDEIYKYLKERAKDGHKILPESKDTFKSFLITPYESVHTIFLFIDPYPWIKDGVIVANGLPLDCSNTGIIQPTLESFYEGIEDDIFNGLNLNWEKYAGTDYLSNQGILLLNAALTVEENKPGSHFDLWKPFTKYLFEEIFTNYNKGLIIVLCGKPTHYYERFINPLQHYIIKVESPSVAVGKGRKWRHEGVFSRINRILLDNNNITIDWTTDLPF